MMTRKFDITYSIEKIWNKDLFIYVNHKVATLCWAVLKQKTELCDVITFDSHRDYRDGVILQKKTTTESLTLPIEKRCFSSKYYQEVDFPHFTTSKEFMHWNPLDEKQNERIALEQKYFAPNNDNFIDVAFMKGLVSNVYCYFIQTRNETHSGKCDDVFGKTHFFEMMHIENFRKPKPNRKFVLDIDQDFFTKSDYESGDPESVVIPEPDLKKYISLMKSLGQQENCVGITLALEPDCCGSEENCLTICSYFSEVFDKDITSVSKYRIAANYQIH